MTQREWTTQDYLTLLRRWRILIIIFALAGATLAYGFSRFIPNRYRSSTTVLVEQPTVPERFVPTVVSEDINERLASMKQQILSRTRLEPIIRQLGLFSEDANHEPMEGLVGKLQSSISVTTIQPLVENGPLKVPGFSISVLWENPRTAQEICTAISSMFIQEEIKLREQHSEDTTQFMGQELTEAKAKLDEQDGKLADFEAHHMGSLPDDMQNNFQRLGGLYSALDAATQALNRAQLDEGLAKSMLQQQIAARKASQTGKNPETYGEELATLETQLATLQAKYTDDYPDVIKIKTQIAAIRQKMAESDEANKNLDSDTAGKGGMEPLQFIQLRAQIHADDLAIAEKTKQQEQIQQEIKAVNALVQSSPAIEQQYKELTRDYQTALEFYKDLLNKRAQSEMATELEHRQESEQFITLDPANLPDKPDFPNRPEFALGGLGGGLALGLGIAFLLEMRDTSMRTERDVEATLRLPVLAMVPAIGHLSGKKGKAAVGPLIGSSDLGAGA